MVVLGQEMPDFRAPSTQGDISFHQWLEGSWAILFSHPADYTPVCTTELGRVESISEEFKKRGVKLIALSCDDVESHKGWIKDIKAFSKKATISYPIIADPRRDIAVELGMLDPEEKDSEGLPVPCRAVFIVGPDRKLKLSLLYPATTGRNFDEILRVVDSLQLTANKKVATPADWKALKKNLQKRGRVEKQQRKKQKKKSSLVPVVDPLLTDGLVKQNRTNPKANITLSGKKKRLLIKKNEHQRTIANPMDVTTTEHALEKKKKPAKAVGNADAMDVE